jgi:alpha-L-fucosidase
MDGKPVPWETCQTFSGSWGYHRDESTWKSVRQLLVLLIETVSKGGNLLLNVGPTARGTFDERALQKLQGIGAWMELHNRSIYNCTQAPDDFKAPEHSLLTYNPETRRLYIHLLDWPLVDIYLDGYAEKIKYVQLLNDGSEIKFGEQGGAWLAPEKGSDGGSLKLNLPILKPDVEVPVLEVFLK